MKSKLVAALFLGLGLVSTNSLSGHAYQNHSSISTASNSQFSLTEVEFNNNLKGAKFQNANTNNSFQIAQNEPVYDVRGKGPTTRFAHLKNNAGYVVRYIYQYTLDGTTKEEKGTLSLGFSKTFQLHRGGKDFSLKVQPVGRDKFVIDQKLGAGDYYCFSTKGTIFNPSYTTPRLRGTYQGPKCE